MSNQSKTLELKLSPDLFRPLPQSEKHSEQIARPSITYWSDAWRRFKENKIALIAMIILAILVLMAIFVPIVSPYNFKEIVNAKNMAPSAQHWFGTDDLGRDLFTRVFQGMRVSLIIGLLGAIISMVIGTIYGAISAYAGGKVDTIMMRAIEILGSVPYLLVVILIQLFFNKRSIPILILALTITGWLGMARIVRGQLLSLKNQDFVLAAQTLGVSSGRIITSHLIPNTMNVIIVALTFDIPGYIFAEAFLSFIGIGLSSPDTSLGALAAAGQVKFLFYPYQLIFPSIAIALIMLVFTLMGDGLRDALDPRLRQ